MFLEDWLNWFKDYPVNAAAVFAAAALFAWMYITALRMRRSHDEIRLSRLQDNLRLYAAAEYALWLKLHEPAPADETPEPASSGDLPARLIGCLAAPYITEDLRFQIGAYLRDSDAARIGPLYRIISRETAKLADEHRRLLDACEQPGWGGSLWRQLRAALPFVFLAAGLALCAWLAVALYNLPPSYESGYAWDVARCLSLFASGLFSLLMLGQALLTDRRPSQSGRLQRGLSAVIGLLFLIHLAGIYAAPYVLVVQLLLFGLGFIWTDGKPRKTRPFVGSYELTNNQEGEVPPPAAAEAEDTRPDSNLLP